MIFVLIVVLVTLIFTYTNGFHDTANSIATVVSTKVLTPRQAILMATVFNLLGALAGTAVAAVVGKGLVDSHFVNSTTILCGLIGAIAWNLLTWYYGIPSSSSHALIGGLIGAAVASRSEEHTSELQSPCNLVCRLLLEKKNIVNLFVIHNACRMRSRFTL